MATENLSFRDAILFKKSSQVTSDFSYSNNVNMQPVLTPLNIYFPTPVLPKYTTPQFPNKIRHRSTPSHKIL